MSPISSPSRRLIVLYGVGGLSDVGRHAVQVALDLQQQQHEEEASGAAPGAAPALASSSSSSSSSSPIRITVLTKFPDLLLEDNWNCGCPQPHSVDVVKLAASAGEGGSPRQARLEVVKVTDWKDASLRAHFAAPSPTPTTTTTTVISCLGNRQTFGPNDASEAMEHLILPAMRQHGVQRLVCLTSVGVEEDWPPIEFFAVGRVALSCMFKTVSRRAFRDLTKMERLVRGAAADSDSKDGGGGGNIDFLLVRPVGIGEDVKPEGRWQLQKEKFSDKLGYDMAKLDVARFMVTQALHPTLHSTAVVVGAVLDETAAQKWE